MKSRKAKEKTCNYIKKNFNLLVLLFALCLGSCTYDPVTSFNRFIIDNQSSTELFYNTGSGLDERTIEIPRFNLTEIEVTAFDGDRVMLIQAEEFFTQTENDIYLLRETDGVIIEALQLNTVGVLNWEIERVSDDTYNHILQVTDEMLN